MAKNRSMAAKHAKAKKYAMKEFLDNENKDICCYPIKKTIFMSNKSHITSRDSFFYSKYAIQKRIDVLLGRHYPIKEFYRDWTNIYEYLATHTVPEARQYFGSVITLI